MSYEVAARSDSEIAALPDARERATVALLDLCQLHLTDFSDSPDTAE